MVNGLQASAGDHICVFYRGRAERDRVAVPFLREGVEAGDTCVCIIHAADHQRMTRAASVDGPGQLRMADYSETYLRDGAFVGERMLGYWQEWAEQVFVREGASFARGVTDMSWGPDAYSESVLVDFLAYEVQATRFARAYPQVALCMYDLDRFGGNVIIPVLKVHPKVLFGGLLLENPYYVDPDEVEAEAA